MTRAPLTLDVSPFRDALRDLTLFLIECPKDILPSLIKILHPPLGLCVIELDSLAAGLTDHTRLVMKPSERLLMLIAAAGAGNDDRSVVKDFVRHESSSVGSLEPAQRSGRPDVVKAAFGLLAADRHRGLAMNANEPCSQGPADTAAHEVDSSPHPNPDISELPQLVRGLGDHVVTPAVAGG
ncbi:hypothetical protein V1281_002608 [Nitrobacteraceae bacterium AZCC 2161]